MAARVRTTAPRLIQRDEVQIDPAAFGLTVEVRDPEIIRDLIADGSLDAVISSAITAELIGISDTYLRNLRSVGQGPVSLRSATTGHTTGYRLSDVRAYIAGLDDDSGTNADASTGGAA
ncbi:MAG: hypothetical protein ACTMKY_00895 [Dermabacteraceae bacterium]|uniref:hypothetical protein n=1 Tax=unclassified Brachybacterium TaxID=2623841 RepID=UPI003F904C49